MHKIIVRVEHGAPSHAPDWRDYAECDDVMIAGVICARASAEHDGARVCIELRQTIITTLYDSDDDDEFADVVSAS